MAVPLEDHRAPDMADFILPLLADLKQIFRTQTGTVLVFPGSGTGGWEAALRNTLDAGDRVLGASFGQFSMLWMDMCRQLGLNATTIECNWGDAPRLMLIAGNLKLTNPIPDQRRACLPERNSHWRYN